jgi:hypothetical protein
MSLIQLAWKSISRNAFRSGVVSLCADRFSLSLSTPDLCGRHDGSSNERCKNKLKQLPNLSGG